MYKTNIVTPLVLLVFGLVSVCSGRDIFVSGKRGDDQNSGHFVKDHGLTDGPVQTVARALELARPGDRIILDPNSGPYRESIRLVGRRLSGDAEWPFVIEGCGAILEGSEPVPPGVWQHFRGDIYRFQLTMQPVNTTFFQLFNDGEPLPRVAVGPDAPSIPELEPDSWCLFRGFVYFRTEPLATPSFGTDYELSYSARMSGISLIQVRNVRIHDLTFRGFQLDGISAANGALDVVLDNVACEANGRSGLAVGGASNVYAGYSRFEKNRTSQVLALPYSRCLLFECPLNADATTVSDDAVLEIKSEADEDAR